jgi:hypothetical protein
VTHRLRLKGDTGYSRDWSERCAQVDEVAARVPGSERLAPPRLVFRLGDHRGTGGAESLQCGIHVIYVDPEAEPILLGCADSADADARASSFHRQILGFAVGRELIDRGEPERLVAWGVEQTVDLPTAIRAYTMGGAFANHCDTNRGSVSPGKYADLIVLSEDLFGLEPTAILETRVVTTIVGGQVQFRAA